jgi:hypothetical protein
LVHRFYDFWGVQKKDYHFTVHAYKELVNKLVAEHEMDQVILWSDGGLKTKELLYYLSEHNCKKGLTTAFHYFAPYHGTTSIPSLLSVSLVRTFDL